MSTRTPTEPKHFLIPIDGLVVTRPWVVGAVVIHPGAAADALISTSPPFPTEQDFVRANVLEILNSAANSSIAEVPRVTDIDIDDAIDAVRASLDALRLFQLARRKTHTTSFGLPGELHRSSIKYVAILESGSSHGGCFEGDSPGWTFSDNSFEDWSSSTGFQFLSEALASPETSEGARRAALGAQGLAQAAREHRAGLKMLGVTAALEAWLLHRDHDTKGKRLARHVAWFGCGRHNQQLCGRERPICPYLHLNPDNNRDRKRLNTMRTLGNTYAPWRCSEWHRVMDWYDARSDAAHGNPLAVELEHANKAEYWTTHHLTEPILEWLGAHREDPIGDLEREINRIDNPRGWDRMVMALDAPSPPAQPPSP